MKLVKSNAANKCATNEVGTYRHAWDLILSQIEVRAAKHTDFATRLIDEITTPISIFSKENERKKNMLIREGQRLSKEYADSVAHLHRAKANYMTKAKEADQCAGAYLRAKTDPKTKAPDVNKLKARSAKALEQASGAHSEYKEQLEKTNAQLSAYYSQEMPALLGEFQDHEQARTLFMRLTLRTYAALENELPVEYQRSSMLLTQSATSIDGAKDIVTFLDAHSTNASPPPPFDLENAFFTNMTTNFELFDWTETPDRLTAQDIAAPSSSTASISSSSTSSTSQIIEHSTSQEAISALSSSPPASTSTPTTPSTPSTSTSEKSTATDTTTSEKSTATPTTTSTPTPTPTTATPTPTTPTTPTSTPTPTSTSPPTATSPSSGRNTTFTRAAPSRRESTLGIGSGWVRSSKPSSGIQLGGGTRTDADARRRLGTEFDSSLVGSSSSEDLAKSPPAAAPPPKPPKPDDVPLSIPATPSSSSSSSNILSSSPPASSIDVESKAVINISYASADPRNPMSSTLQITSIPFNPDDKVRLLIQKFAAHPDLKSKTFKEIVLCSSDGTELDDDEILESVWQPSEQLSAIFF